MDWLPKARELVTVKVDCDLNEHLIGLHELHAKGEDKEALRELFGQTTVTRDLQLGPTDGPLRAMLFRVATILLDERDESGGWRMRVEGSPDRLRFLERRFGAADLSQWIGPDASVVP